MLKKIVFGAAVTVPGVLGALYATAAPALAAPTYEVPDYGTGTTVILSPGRQEVAADDVHTVRTCRWPGFLDPAAFTCSYAVSL